MFYRLKNFVALFKFLTCLPILRPKKKEERKNYKGGLGIWLGFFFIIRYHYCCLCCFFHSSSKVPYTLAKICKRYYTLDKLAEKHQPRDCSKFFSRCCESISMKIIYDCMHQLKLEFYTAHLKLFYNVIITCNQWYFDTELASYEHYRALFLFLSLI